jgi:hypothetical protein
MLDFQPASLDILFERRDRNASFDGYRKLTTPIQWNPTLQKWLERSNPKGRQYPMNHHPRIPVNNIVVCFAPKN